jgi:hypothetical protein
MVLVSQKISGDCPEKKLSEKRAGTRMLPHRLFSLGANFCLPI